MIDPSNRFAIMELFTRKGPILIKWIVVFILAFAILVFSRKSLLKPRSHGFWRFFAWVLILILITLNLEFWFRDPWSWHQIIAWILLFACLIPLFFGVHSLTKRGRPAANRQGEPQLLAFEKTTTLVTTGIYRYIRHPLYSSLLLLTWGIFFKHPTWIGAFLAAAASICLYLTALADEQECLQFFGEPYRAYMQKSRRFLPYLF